MASKKIKKLSTAAVAATMVLPTVADGMMIVSAKENIMPRHRANRTAARERRDKCMVD